MKELNIIQTKLNAPKNQYNSFGKYSYRSCEDILEALKPLLEETGCTLTLSDEVVLIGDRYYVKATATLRNSEGETAVNTAYAREPEKKTGMDEAQITGATSSYCRKYCLNGLFCIDDCKDPDAPNTHGQEVSQAPAEKPSGRRGRKPTQQTQPVQQEQHFDNSLQFAIQQVSLVGSTEDLNKVWQSFPQWQSSAEFIRAIQSSPYHPNNKQK